MAPKTLFVTLLATTVLAFPAQPDNFDYNPKMFFLNPRVTGSAFSRALFLQSRGCTTGCATKPASPPALAPRTKPTRVAPLNSYQDRVAQAARDAAIARERYLGANSMYRIDVDLRNKAADALKRGKSDLHETWQSYTQDQTELAAANQRKAKGDPLSSIDIAREQAEIALKKQILAADQNSVTQANDAFTDYRKKTVDAARLAKELKAEEIRKKAALDWNLRNTQPAKF